MELISNIYITAFVLGAVHAIEVDHMVAVSVFAGMKPKLRSAASYGCKWGLGHAITVVLVGGLIAWFGLKVPESIVRYGEIFVGIALVALGVWAIKTSKEFHAHSPEEHAEKITNHEYSHGHLHAHMTSGDHIHDHAHENKVKHHQHLPAALGALHGLAGSAPVLALIPITLLDDFQHAVYYLLIFSIGTTLSMMFYAVLAAIAIQRVSRRTVKDVDGNGYNNLLNVRLITRCISGVTILVGVWWIIRALNAFV